MPPVPAGAPPVSVIPAERKKGIAFLCIHTVQLPSVRFLFLWHGRLRQVTDQHLLADQVFTSGFDAGDLPSDAHFPDPVLCQPRHKPGRFIDRKHFHCVGLCSVG